MYYFWLILVWNIVFQVSLVAACGSDLPMDLPKLLFKYEFEFTDLTLPFLSFDVPGSKLLENMTMIIADGGTHIEAPCSKEQVVYVNTVPMTKLFVQLIYIDISAEVKKNSKYVLSMKVVNSTLNKALLHHMSEWPSLVVFRFGWSHYYYHDLKTYIGYDNSTKTYHLPAISNEVAEWITTCESCKKVVGMGVDLPSIDAGGKTSSSSVRESLIEAGMYIIEGMNLNSSLPSYKCMAMVSPLKIKQCSATSNVLAMCLKPHHEKKNNHDRKKRDTYEHEQHHSMRGNNEHWRHNINGSHEHEYHNMSENFQHGYYNMSGNHPHGHHNMSGIHKHEKRETRERGHQNTTANHGHHNMKRHHTHGHHIMVKTSADHKQEQRDTHGHHNMNGEHKQEKRCTHGHGHMSGNQEHGHHMSGNQTHEYLNEFLHWHDNSTNNYTNYLGEFLHWRDNDTESQISGEATDATKKPDPQNPGNGTPESNNTITTKQPNLIQAPQNLLGALGGSLVKG